jgi:hypothetical protein
MSHTPEQLLEILSNYEKLSNNSLLKNAKGKEKKKVDPKAKVRNRGTVCVPAESAKDKKDHFPINDEDQARNALARVHQYSSVPSWYSGSLKGLQDAVSRKVHSKYPSIGKADKKKKSSARQAILAKYAGKNVESSPVQISESLLQKYSEEGQIVDRLIGKYGQVAPNTYSYWNAKQLADNAKSGNINLDDLHRSGKITNEQYNQAYQLVHGTVAPGATNQPKQVETTQSNLRGVETPTAPLPTNIDRGGYHIDHKGVWHKNPTHQAKRDPDGFDTKAVQQQLLNKGYNLGPTGVDGDWGQLSEAAFRNFKKDFYLQQVNDKEAKRRLLSNELPTNMRPTTKSPVKTEADSLLREPGY